MVKKNRVFGAAQEAAKSGEYGGYTSELIEWVQPQLVAENISHPKLLALLIVLIKTGIFAFLFNHYASDCEYTYLGFVPFDDFDAKGPFLTNDGLTYPNVYVNRITVRSYIGAGLTEIYTPNGLGYQSNYQGRVINGKYYNKKENMPGYGCNDESMLVHRTFADSAGQFQRKYVRYLKSVIGEELTGNVYYRAQAMQKALLNRSFDGWDDPRYKQAMDIYFACRKEQIDRDLGSRTKMKAMSQADYREVWATAFKMSAMVSTNLRASIECFPGTTWQDCVQESPHVFPPTFRRNGTNLLISKTVEYPHVSGFTTETSRDKLRSTDEDTGPKTGFIYDTLNSLSHFAASSMTIEYHVCNSLDEAASLAFGMLAYVVLAVWMTLIMLVFVLGGCGTLLARKDDDLPDLNAQGCFNRMSRTQAEFRYTMNFDKLENKMEAMEETIKILQAKLAEAQHSQPPPPQRHLAAVLDSQAPLSHPCTPVGGSPQTGIQKRGLLALTAAATAPSVSQAQSAAWES